MEGARSRGKEKDEEGATMRKTREEERDELGVLSISSGDPINAGAFAERLCLLATTSFALDQRERSSLAFNYVMLIRHLQSQYSHLK